MKFLESLYGLSLKQRAALNTVKLISGFLSIATIGAILLMTFGWNAVLWSILAVSCYFIVKTLYEHNLFKLEHEIRMQELEKEAQDRIKASQKKV